MRLLAQKSQQPHAQQQGQGSMTFKGAHAPEPASEPRWNMLSPQPQTVPSARKASA